MVEFLNSRRINRAFGACVISAGLAMSSASAHPHNAGDHHPRHVHENGIGADPDRDTNPATVTGGFYAERPKSDNPPYEAISFEAPPGRHGDIIEKAFSDASASKTFSVSFSPSVQRQICDGVQRFRYDTLCTYDAAPTGRYAVGYEDILNTPLTMEFDSPVCVVSMAIYPTGGKEGENFTIKIEGWDDNDKKLETVKVPFEWTKQTVRWRYIAGAYYLDERASKIKVSMTSARRIKLEDGEDYIEPDPADYLSPEERNKPKPATRQKRVRYLIDDLALVDYGCEAALKQIRESEIIFNGERMEDPKLLKAFQSAEPESQKAILSVSAKR